MRIVAVELRRLDQAHRRRGALPTSQRCHEQPVRASERNGPDPVLDPVVVDGHSPVLEEARKRCPAVQAGVDGFGDRSAVARTLPMRDPPLPQRLGDQFGSQLPQPVALLGIEFARQTLDLVDRPNEIERFACERALVTDSQLMELAPRVRQATRLGLTCRLDHRLLSDPMSG